MDNVPGPLQAGTLSKALRHFAHALVWHIESVYSLGFEAVQLKIL